MRGRKPLPPNVHRLRGNPSKLSKEKLNGIPSHDIEIPEPPTRLDGEALVEWGRITHELAALGLIAKIDRAGLVLYCQHWQTFEMASEKISALGDNLLVKHPNGFSGPSPWLAIRDRSGEALRKMLVEFGLSPSARTRVKPTGQRELFDKPELGRYFN